MNQNSIPEVSDTELQQSYWYVTHYKKLKHLLVICLATFSGLLLVFSAWNVTEMYLLIKPYNETLKQDLLLSLSELYQPPSVVSASIETVGSRLSEEGFENGYAILSNTNEHWYLRADLVFLRDTIEIGSVPIFLAPNTKRLFVGSGLPVGQLALSALLKNVHWAYVSTNQNLLVPLKNGVRVSDISFLSSDKSGASRFIPVSKLKFSVTNATSSDFWEIRIPLLIKDRGVVVGVSEATLGSINAGEKKSIEAIWFTPIVNADEFDIQPLIDIFDPDTIKKKFRQ